MSEKTDYQTFRRHIVQGKERMDRVENIAGSGIPDVNYCIDGVEGWIEMKSPREPKHPNSILFRQSYNHRLSQTQKNWFLKQRNAGGRAFILICTDKRWMLIDKWQADFVNEMTVNQLESEAIWLVNKPIQKCQWKRLREVLCEN